MSRSDGTDRSHGIFSVREHNFFCSLHASIGGNSTVLLHEFQLNQHS